MTAVGRVQTPCRSAADAAAPTSLMVIIFLSTDDISAAPECDCAVLAGAEKRLGWAAVVKRR